MNVKTREIFVVAFLLITITYFLVEGMIGAQSFFAPLLVASLLAMIFLPLAGKLERAGFNRGWAALVSVLVGLSFFVGLFFLVSMQVQRISSDWPQIKQRLEPQVEQLQYWVYQKTGLNAVEQKEVIKDNLPGGGEDEKEKQDTSAVDSTPSPPVTSTASGNSTSGSSSGESSSSKSIFKMVGTYVLGFLGFVGTALLTGVYLFFILLYRSKIKKSILRFFSADKKDEAEVVIRSSVELSQSYLIGRFILIFILAVLYAIGLSISGVKHAILISIIAAVLSIVPYVGNIVGYVLAMAMAAFSGASVMAFVGVTVTFGVAQFVESYMLEPYVVGHKVNLNPLATIVVVVLGGAIWGIIGMIIFIPLIGILKIACDHIPVLHPLGYLLGEEDIASSEDEGFLMRMGRRVMKVFGGRSSG